MDISYKKLKFAAVMYAVLPIAIFFLGWLNILSAVFFTALLTAAAVFFYKNLDNDGEFNKIRLSVKSVVAVAIIALVWCFIAGQGGFVHQSSDHVIRNAIFRDLIAKPWPVAYDDGNSMLSYYIAHWMPPALLGKMVLAITGSRFAAYLLGNIFLLLWSSLGVFIVLMLLSLITNTGKKQMIFTAIFMFIMFSGLDYVGAILRKNINLLYSNHIEWWGGWFQFSSNSTCLFWVFNQTIVPWMLVMCIMNEIKLKNLALMGILILPYGPFPFVGAIVLCALKAAVIAYKKIKEGKLTEAVKDVLSPQNILSMLAVSPVYILYYSANMMVSGGNTGFRINDFLKNAAAVGNYADIWSYIRVMILFWVLEAGLYLFIVLKRQRRDIVSIGMGASLIFIPLFQIGGSADFAMRVSIPALVYICVRLIGVVLKEIPTWEELSQYKGIRSFIKSKKLLVTALLIFTLGMGTSALEFKREFLLTISTPYSKNVNYFEKESLQNYGKGNFCAANYKQSDFYKYLCKKSKEN